MSISIDFDAAIAQKNKFATKPVAPWVESPIDLVTAKMLNADDSKALLQEIRLLIVVEKADYSAHLSGLINGPTNGQTTPKQNVAPLSRADAQILNAASAWSQQVQEVAIFSCESDKDYNEICPLGIRLMGGGLANQTAKSGPSTGQIKKKEKQMLRLAADFFPTHIIAIAPNYSFLRWANRRHIDSIVMLNDWQQLLMQGLLGKQRQRKAFIKQLNHPQVKWIGSQGVSACQAMANSGVDANKLVPWEWSDPHKLDQYPPKSLSRDRDSTQLLYAGSLADASRVDDLLAALSILKQRGQQAELEILVDRATPQSALQSLALQSQQLDILERVTISLSDSIQQVLAQVRRADIVVIPGDASSPEKIDIEAVERKGDSPQPMIVQVAMAACTPIVACDRPYLKNYLIHSVNAMIFPEGNEKSMAHRIERLIGQPQLYAQLSESGDIAQRRQNLPADWQEIIERWMCASPDNKQWLKKYVLSSGRYHLPRHFVA